MTLWKPHVLFFPQNCVICDAHFFENKGRASLPLPLLEQFPQKYFTAPITCCYDTRYAYSYPTTWFTYTLKLSLQLRNGRSRNSPMLGQGRYCGTQPPRDIPETSANELSVTFVGLSAAAVSSYKDFLNMIINRVILNSRIFWDMMPCSSKEHACCLLDVLFNSEDGDNIFFWNITKLLPDYMMSHSRR